MKNKIIFLALIFALQGYTGPAWSTNAEQIHNHILEYPLFRRQFAQKWAPAFSRSWQVGGVITRLTPPPHEAIDLALFEPAAAVLEQHKDVPGARVLLEPSAKDTGRAPVSGEIL
jgi:hypothetical protein